jgi:uncharacterized damage-inducible protein DinB
MPDPILIAAQHILKTAVADMRTSIDGVMPEALNWRPAGDDTNTIAVLAVHSMTSTRSWFSVAVGAPLPERDRPSEFRATASGPDDLIAFIEDMQRDCAKLLDEGQDVDWSAVRTTHARPNDASERVSAAWALMHALEHLREHTGQILLTHQLYDRRSVSD